MDTSLKKMMYIYIYIHIYIGLNTMQTYMEDLQERQENKSLTNFKHW